jgi:HTH-type transcriptional regulator / antitoxin HigA
MRRRMRRMRMADPMKERARRVGQLHSDLAVPPGEYLKEILEAQGMSTEAFAARSGIPPERLAAIIEGTEPITASAADGLAEPTGVPANIWLGLEAEYWPALADAATDERQGV